MDSTDNTTSIKMSHVCHSRSAAVYWEYNMAGDTIRVTAMDAWGMGHYWYIIDGPEWWTEFHFNVPAQIFTDDILPDIQGSTDNFERNMLYVKMLFG